MSTDHVGPPGTGSGHALVEPAPISAGRGTTAVTLRVAATTTAFVSTIALLWAYYVDTPWKAQARGWGIDDKFGATGLLWIAGFVALGVAVVYGVVVRRAMAGDPTRAARTALVLALIGLPTGVFAFWTGLPIVLGSAAAYLGMDSRARLGRTPGSAAAAIALGLVVAAFTIYFCVTG
jgi:hypothetical protein